MNKIKQISIICFFAAIAFLWSCEDNETVAVYDSSKPVKFSGFEPETGGLATKVFITGSNFGSDLSKIRVWFSGYLGEVVDEANFLSVRAPVVGSDGEHIYVLTPRLSNMGECTISVVVGKDSVNYTSKRYMYRTMTTVTTVAGKRGTSAFVGGTLSEATFMRPHTLCVDDDGNIFLSQWGMPNHWNSPSFVLISPHNNLVQALHTGTEFGAPTVDEEGVVLAPTDGREGYYFFDPQTLWAPQARAILHPSAEQIAGGMQDFSIDWKHGMSYCEVDKCVYTRGYNSQLVKFDPTTRVGQFVASLSAGDVNSYPYFDPLRPHIMYIVYDMSGQIFTYDINTKESELFAGSSRGWKDGFRLDAEFGSITQMVVKQDGVILVADRTNHCIRQITPDGMVTTLIGKGGIAGHQDGNPEDALFDNPTGIAIGKDGSIYVAEYGNNCVRRLAEE